MESRAALLASMSNATKSVKILITEANLRLNGLKGSPPTTSEPAVGGVHAGGREQGPEQQPQSPPRRRSTGVTIREPAATHRAAEPSVPKGKRKQKVTEPAKQSDDSSDVHGMNSGDFFAHYQAAAEASVPKDGKRVLGESSKTPAKKAQTENASTDAPSKENLTHPPAPKQQTPSPANPRSSSKAVDKEAMDHLSEGSLPNHGFLSWTASWRRAGAMVSREKNLDSRLAQAKQVLEDEKAKLLEENSKLLANEERKKWRESAVLNTRECKQLNLDLTASRDEVTRPGKRVKELEERIQELEEDGAGNLEKYKEATFLSFYDFWKHNQGAKIVYLAENLQQSLMAECTARFEAEKRAKAQTLAASAKDDPPADKNAPAPK
ncbi:uncharacterized protein LOC133784668 [Humulus lupulus]|uniref:uncharacterized protein LOC133784668 n=1 Tax=Humulus lupulus TaxID=3486 RepID=UPI002B4061A4|nr:uncharacterized protein LOC133784668 [Humulus lupulus]